MRRGCHPPGVARGGLGELLQSGRRGQAHTGLSGDGVALLVVEHDDGDAVGRQGVGSSLVLAGGGASDDLGELGVSRIVQDESLT